MPLRRAWAVSLLTMAVIALATPADGIATAAVPAGGRSWELVTPSGSIGATVVDVLGVRGDGRRLVYVTQGSTPDALGGDVIGQNLATRTEDGWQTKSISGAYNIPKFDLISLLTSSVRAISPDFSSVVKINSAPPRPEAPADL